MRPETKQKLLEALAGEEVKFCKTVYVDCFKEDGPSKFCAVGYLAHKAGVEMDVLISANAKRVDQKNPYITQINQALHDVYGIEVDDLVEIQNANDTYLITPTSWTIAEFIKKEFS